MTKHLTLLLFIGLAWGQRQYNIDHIVKQGGVHKKKFSDELVNGEVFQMSGDITVPLGKMKNGRKEGVWIDWYDNGTKKTQINFSNGNEFGLAIVFDEKGRKIVEYDRRDSLNYTEIRYYQNGSKMTEGEVVNGKWFNGTRLVMGYYRKSIYTIRDGVLIKIEEFEDFDLENKVVVRVDDCVNTDDCLSEEEKRLKYSVNIETVIKDAIGKTKVIIEANNEEEVEVLKQLKIITNREFDGNVKDAYKLALSKIDAPKKIILKAVKTVMMMGIVEKWIIANPIGTETDFKKLPPHIFNRIKNNNNIAKAFRNAYTDDDLPSLDDLFRTGQIIFNNPIQNYSFNYLNKLISDLIELTYSANSSISKSEVQKAIIEINEIYTNYNIILSLHNNGLVEEQRPLVFKN